MNMKYQFQWFPPEDGRKPLRASVSKEGKLRLGRALQAVLPSHIRVGFDETRKVLAIADGHGQGVPRPKCGIVPTRTLSRQLTALGLTLPICFQLARDPSTGYYLGHVIPRYQKAPGSRRRSLELGQIPILYRHVLTEAVGQLAKSTPLAERRSIALSALLEAAQRYRPGCGEVEDYLRCQVRSSLLRENRPYAAAYGHRSLDAPLSWEEGSAFSLYDTLAAADDGGIAAAEERIMARQFWDSLSAQERQLAQMLQDGFLLSHIADRLDMAEEALTELAHGISQKRRAFYAA